MTNANNWVTVCQASDLVDNSGVCALVNEQQVALFKIKQTHYEQPSVTGILLVKPMCCIGAY